MSQNKEKQQKLIRIIDDVFMPPQSSYKKHWESLSIEEKIMVI